MRIIFEEKLMLLLLLLLLCEVEESYCGSHVIFAFSFLYDLHATFVLDSKLSLNVQFNRLRPAAS